MSVDLSRRAFVGRLLRRGEDQATWKLSRRQSGQALLEFAMVGLLLMVLLFGVVDCGRYLVAAQVLVCASREGANIASRDSDFPAAATAAVNAAPALTLDSSQGRVFITAVQNVDGKLMVTGQSSRGTLSVASRVLNADGKTATLPTQALSLLQTGGTLCVAEVYYKFTAVTPIGNVVGTPLPSTLYSVAYF